MSGLKKYRVIYHSIHILLLLHTLPLKSEQGPIFLQTRHLSQHAMHPNRTPTHIFTDMQNSVTTSFPTHSKLARSLTEEVKRVK